MPQPLIESEVEHGRADLGDVTLHYVEGGDGPLVVLLHGFPEFWYSWRHQIPALIRAGFRVVAPDMRGYNRSEKPPRVRDYRIANLTQDVAHLIQYFGEEEAVLVGHDWGAVVGWQFAMRYPDMVRRLGILNVPHPAHMKSMMTSLKQLRRSWYILFFQIPWLPEALIRANDFAFMRKTFAHDPVRTGAFSEEDIQAYIDAFSRPGAITSPLNYYRAMLRYDLFDSEVDALTPIEAPTLVIWGEQDKALGVEFSEPPVWWVPNATVERLPDASHWVQCDRPDRVNELLLEFIA